MKNYIDNNLMKQIKGTSLILFLICFTIFSVSTYADAANSKKRKRFYNQSVHQSLPSKYLLEVDPTEKRDTLIENLKIGLYSDFNSRYMSKEMPFSKGPVWQPSVTFELYGLGLNTWANFVLNDEANQGQFNEVDLIPYYNLEIGNFTFHPYSMIMFFPNKNPNSLDYTKKTIIEADFYLKYKLGEFAIFSLTRLQVRGGTAGGAYFNLGLGYSHKFQKGFTLESSIFFNFGNSIYLSSNYGNMSGNVDQIVLMLGASINPRKGLTFKPNIHTGTHIIPKIRKSIKTNPNISNTMVWGGLEVAYEF